MDIITILIVIFALNIVNLTILDEMVYTIKKNNKKNNKKEDK